MNGNTQYTMQPKCRSRWKSGFLAVLVVGVGVVVGLRFLRNASSVPMPRVMEAKPRMARPTILQPKRVPYIPPAPDAVVPDAQPSVSQASDVLLADIYPSRLSAISALALHVPGAISQVSQDPAEIHLTVHGSESDARPIAGSIIQSFPSAHFAQKTDLDRGTSWPTEGINVSVTIDEPYLQLRRATRPGSVQIQVKGPAQTSVLTTTFMNHPWVDQFSEYVNQHPDHSYIVARTPKPALGQIEAARNAEAAASNEILSLVLRQTSISGRATSPDVRAAILRDIQRSLPIMERFDQRFDRPYGKIYAQSILIEASPTWLESMARRQTVVSQQQQFRIKTTGASTAIVLVTIILAYLFLNAVTKSYFSGRLRTLAIILALVAVAVAAGVISAA